MTEVTSVDITEILSKIVNTYDTGGKGRKQCNKCRKYVGCKVLQCGCGFVFGSEPKLAAPKDRLDLEAEDLAKKIGKAGSQHVILYASGPCPITLEGYDAEHVEEWVALLISHGKAVNIFYSPSSMRHYIGQFFDRNSNEHKLAIDNLKNYLENITV